MKIPAGPFIEFRHRCNRTTVSSCRKYISARRQSGISKQQKERHLYSVDTRLPGPNVGFHPIPPILEPKRDGGYGAWAVVAVEGNDGRQWVDKDVQIETLPEERCVRTTEVFGRFYVIGAEADRPAKWPFRH
jgi:hypothetical protein